jgi:hypothetical protein
MQIIIQKQKTVDLEELTIEFVRDLFEQKRIIARVKNLPQGIVLWDGEEEYNKAGNWTNETAQARLLEVLALPEIPWAF